MRFRVRSDAPEEVHVHCYDIAQATSRPGKTITVSFKASITGIFEIEFHNSGEADRRVESRAEIGIRLAP